MQEKVLAMIGEKVLARTFNFNGKDMLFKDYLIQEVLPYLDLNKETVKLKSKIDIPLKNFIEQEVFNTCQKRYHGNFADFAKDNLLLGEYKNIELSNNKKQNNNQTIAPYNVVSKSTQYAFYQESTGPKYVVTISFDDVLLSYKDGDFWVTMESLQDQKDFLKRIKKLDIELFTDLLHKNDVFKNFVFSFKSDRLFFNNLLAGINDESTLDYRVDQAIIEIGNLIDAVDKELVLYFDDRDKVIEENNQAFNVDSILPFNSQECLKIILNKCRSFYSEVTNNVEQLLDESNIYEKAEYVVDEYLLKVINRLLNNYVSNIERVFKESGEFEINERFIRDNLDVIMSTLEKELKRVFIGDNREMVNVYINIVKEEIVKEIIKYENDVNKVIEVMFKKDSYNFEENDAIRKVS